MIQYKFEQLVQQQVVRLKDEFTREVESATNPDYARQFFQYRLIERCIYLPYQTVFLNELIKVFYHFCQLDEPKALNKTLEHIARVRQKSKAASENLMDILLQVKVLMNDEKLYFDSLPACYQDQILFEDANLDKLYEDEKKIGKYSNEKIIQLLATYKATMILNKELFSDGQPEEPEIEKTEENKSKTQLRSEAHKRPGLTRLQQVIMYKKFCKMANIDESNCKGSDFAFVFFNFIGFHPELNGIDIYKMILDPYKFCTLEGMIRNLQVVRSLFEYYNNPKSIQLINQEIAEIEKKIKKNKIPK